MPLEGDWQRANPARSVTLPIHTYSITLEPKHTLGSIHRTEQIMLGTDARNDLPCGITGDDN
jgi:hypothetical protein